jgi:RNA 3'-terminal phosphate cyclase-like protein
MGGKVYHDVPVSKSISYVLEPVMALAPFSKNPFVLTLTGITNPVDDITVDSIRTVALPLLQKFGVDEGIELKVFHLHMNSMRVTINHESA